MRLGRDDTADLKKTLERAYRTGAFAWHVTGLLGSGGTADVFAAAPRGGGPEVALKVLRSEVSTNDRDRKSFLREIAAMRLLRHPNIVAFVDHGQVGGRIFVAMESCAGGALHALVQRNGPLPLDEGLCAAGDLLEALACAHRSRVVHRDVNPRNVLLNGAGAVRLCDFGLAKSLSTAWVSTLTKSGEDGWGSVDYLSPEHLADFKHVEPSADVWSSAATILFLLTGKPPRITAPGGHPVVTAARHVARPVRQDHPWLPESIARVLDRALADEPSVRYRDAVAMEAALRDAGAGTDEDSARRALARRAEARGIVKPLAPSRR